MPEPDDITLLRRYAGGDESAFTTLFERYVHLVYSAALRQARNPSHAEEVTQVVFILLTRKAKSLSPKTVLSGWLYQAARLTTANVIKREIRRQRREQEVYMQTLTEPDTSFWEQISPLLDDAMGRLGEKDRNAIVLRFFENRTPQEVAAALKLNEVTARKHVSRALEKLRTSFAKRGVVLTTAIVAGAISANSVQAAPAALANTVPAVALGKAATASVSTLTLAKGTLIAMKTKTVVITAIAATAVIIGAGTGAYLLAHTKRHRPAASAASVPVKLDNDDFAVHYNKSDRFFNDFDPAAKRTGNSAPAIHVKILFRPGADNQSLDNSSSVQYIFDNNSPFLGKRIRITGWLKTRDVQGWGSAYMMIYKDQEYTGVFDDMSDRPIRGTTDWQPIEFVTDVPKEPCVIYFGPDLFGVGELWGDDFQIALAPPNTPITDSRKWRVYGEPFATDYSEETDYLTTHDGHPTICLAYTRDGDPRSGSWTGWQKTMDDPDQYRGHTLRMTGWVKTENVSGRLFPLLQPFAGYSKPLGKDKTPKNQRLKDTLDWTQFSVTCAIPKNTLFLRASFNLNGSGKAWIDMDSVKFEIVK